MVVVLTLPSTRLDEVPSAGIISTSIAIMGVSPLEVVSHDRDNSLSPMLVTTRLDTGSGGTVLP